MNVFQYVDAIQSMMDAHATGAISNENLSVGGAILQELFGAQPQEAISGVTINEARIVAAAPLGDDELYTCEIPGTEGGVFKGGVRVDAPRFTVGLKADPKGVRIAKVAKSVAFMDVVYNLKAAQQAATPYWIHYYQQCAEQAKAQYRTIRKNMGV